MSDLFKAKVCDRCGGSLKTGRITSMYNEDTICMLCKEIERQLPSYKKAQDADIAQIRAGNYNFEGIGYKEDK